MILSHYSQKSKSKLSNYLSSDGHTGNTVPKEIMSPW